MDVWGGAFGTAFGDTWGFVAVVVTRDSGGTVFAEMVRRDKELADLKKRIEADDLEIIAVVVAGLQAGII